MVRSASQSDPNLMGLDLSLTGTGVCVVSPDGEVVDQVQLGVPMTRKANVTQLTNRLLFIVNGILEVKTRSKVGRYAIEDYAYGAKGSQNDLAELHGAVMVQMAIRFEMYAERYSWSTLRKEILGRGNFPKDDILPALRERGMDLRTADIADAYLVAERLRRRHHG